MEALERNARRLRQVVAGQMLLLSAILLAGVGSCATPRTGQPAAQRPESLRVSELIVVDSAGVERVRIGGSLPDAIIGGRRMERGGEKIAGILLYDGTGQERSGYVTFEPSGNVGLTLDTRRGQVAYFIAGPEAGSALKMWHGSDLVELRSDGDGSRMTSVRGGSVLVQVPEVASLPAEACRAYTDALSRLSAEQVMSGCRGRFGAGACAACLQRP